MRDFNRGRRGLIGAAAAIHPHPSPQPWTQSVPWALTVKLGAGGHIRSVQGEAATHLSECSAGGAGNRSIAAVVPVSSF